MEEDASGMDAHADSFRLRLDERPDSIAGSLVEERAGGRGLHSIQVPPELPRCQGAKAPRPSKRRETEILVEIMKTGASEQRRLRFGSESSLLSLSS